MPYGEMEGDTSSLTIHCHLYSEERDTVRSQGTPSCWQPARFSKDNAHSVSVINEWQLAVPQTTSKDNMIAEIRRSDLQLRIW